jgi:hypothetical protein
MNMKKNSLFVLLFCLINSIAQAQGNKDAFYKAVDYSNCKLANAYCQNYAATHKGSKEEIAYKSIQEKLNCKIEAPLSYDSLADLLKRNHFESYPTNIAPEFKQLKELSPESFTKEQAVKTIIDKIFSNTQLSTVITQSGFANQKENLSKELTKYFDGKFPNETATEPITTSGDTKADNAVPEITVDKLQLQIESLKQQVKDNRQYWYSPNWIAIIIAVMLFVVVFLRFRDKYYYLKQKVESYRSDSKSSSKQDVNWDQALSSNNNAKELAKYKKSIEEQLEGVIKIVEDLRTEITYQNQRPKGQETASYDPHQQIEKQQKFEVFFASIPNKDGSFNINAVTNFINPTASFYKFTITDSHSQRASFEFLNEERAIKDATNAPERILRPVCKINNALNQNAKKIKTITPGIVIKQNDRWILDFPAEIEYE